MQKEKFEQMFVIFFPSPGWTGHVRVLPPASLGRGSDLHQGAQLRQLDGRRAAPKA